MVVKKYTVSLEEEVVVRALKIAEKYGGKLSPLINTMLDRWAKKQEEKNNQRGN